MRLLTIFLAAVILCSCNNEDRKSSQPDSNSPDNLKQSFLPIIRGTWVESGYMEDIAETKSPLKSSDKLTSMVVMIIPGAAGGDSVHVPYANIHEGSEFILYFRPGLAPNSLATSSMHIDKPSRIEVGYEIAGEDTTLLIYKYEKNKLIGTIEYFKVQTYTGNELAAGFDYALNQRLFAGNYIFTDNAGAATKVRFNNNGSMTGLAGFKFYYVFTDLEGTEKEDEISFDADTKNRTDYVFEIRGDTVKLYNALKGGEEEPVGRGWLVYQLIRE